MRVRRGIQVLSVIALLVLPIGFSGAALVTGGGFEDGTGASLSGFATYGNTGIVTQVGSSAVTPDGSGGTYFLESSNGVGATPIASPVAAGSGGASFFTGDPAGIGSSITEYSGFTFQAAAALPVNLTMLIDFETGEVSGAEPDVVALYADDGLGGGPVIVAGWVINPSVVPTAPFIAIRGTDFDNTAISDGTFGSFADGQTGWRNISVPIAAGSYTFYLLVGDVSDTIVDTAVSVDNISLVGGIVTVTCPGGFDINGRPLPNPKAECGQVSNIDFKVSDSMGEAVSVTFDVDGSPVPGQSTTVPAGTTPPDATVTFSYTFAGPPGSQSVVTITGTNQTGDVDTCSTTVDIVDTTPPTLSGCNDVTAECQGPMGTVVTWTDPTATDLCDPNPTVTCTPASGSTFPMGTTTVTCTAKDASGNTSTCTFDVIVQDTTSPTLSGCNDVTAECQGPTGTVVTWTDPTASDVCDPNPVVACTPPSGSTFPLGTTLVTCTATDASGNVGTCSFDVVVQDTTPPVVTTGIQRTLLWPPMFGMIPVYLSASARDICQGPLSVTVDVFSDEPDGAAPYAPDAAGTSPATLVLRAERQWPGDGRVYLIRVTATDSSGNVGVSCVSVVVPANLTVSALMSVRAQALAAEAACTMAPTVDPLPNHLLSFTYP